MRPFILSVVLLAACGGSDPDPHVIGACEGWVDNQGNAFTGTCEAACTKPPAATAKMCDTVAKLGCAEFTFGDVEGCCIPEGTTIKFYECQ